MMRRWVIGSLGYWVIGWLGVGAALAGANPLRQGVPEEQRRQGFEAGAFSPLDKPEIVRDFPLKNDSARPLVIRRIHAACGCTTALVRPTGAGEAAGKAAASVTVSDEGATLSPGAETTVRVTLKTAGLRGGEFGKSVTLWADGSPLPVAQLTISGKILPAVSMQPAIDFGSLPSGKGASREISVTVDRRLSGENAPILTSSGSQIQGTPLGKTDEKNGMIAFRYRVSLSAAAPLGPQYESLHLQPAPDAPKVTDGAEIWKTAVAMAGGTVTGDISADPPSLNFGQVDSGSERTMTVTLRYTNGKRDAARKIMVGSPHLRIAPGKATANSETIAVIVRKDAPAATFRSSVTVTLSNGQVLVIPAVGYIQ